MSNERNIENELNATLLSAKEIRARILAFNETYDWTLFDDVPPIQHVDVMYPHLINFEKIITNER